MKIKVWITRVIVLCLVISISMCAGSLGDRSVYAARVYKDVSSNHWAYDNIQMLSESGLLNGYPDGSFLPGKEVTYGEFLKMAVLSSGKKDPSQNPQKKNDNHWAYPYYEEGLNKGYYTNNKIGLGKLSYPIPRGDMALVLSEMLGDWKIEDYKRTQDKIRDVDYRNPDEYHLVKIYDAGILRGYPDGTFKANGTLNRAEAAAVISRFMDAKKKQLFPVPDPPPETELLLLEDFIPNHRDIYLLKDVKYYWITENDPYTYEKAYSLSGIEALKIFPEDRSRVVIFILDNKPIWTSNALAYRYWVNGAKAGDLLPDFDYIGVYPRCSDSMMLIPSPFR